MINGQLISLQFNGEKLKQGMLCLNTSIIIGLYDCLIFIKQVTYDLHKPCGYYGFTDYLWPYSATTLTKYIVLIPKEKN